MANKPDGPVALSRDHIDTVAGLHVEGITGGFISSLGVRFVRCLYDAIVESDQAFGFVAVKDGRVIAFVSCVESVGSIYRHVLKKHFLELSWVILPKMIRWRNIRNAFQTLLYPAKTSDALPSAELLAIVVDQRARGLGVGRALFEQAVREFRRRGIAEFKIMVGEHLLANDFYRRMGCRLAGQHRHHSAMLNAYVCGT